MDMSLYVSMQHDVFLRGNTARIFAKKLSFTAQHYVLEDVHEYTPALFNAIIMRKDPPFDNELFIQYLFVGNRR